MQSCELQMVLMLMYTEDHIWFWVLLKGQWVMKNSALNRSHYWDFQQYIWALVNGAEVLYWSFLRTGLMWRERISWFLLHLKKSWRQCSFSLRKNCKSSQGILWAPLFWNQSLKLMVPLSSIMRRGRKQWEYV